MLMVYSFLIVVLSSFLWRIRGGLCLWGKKLPANKIWYALAFSLYSCFYFGFDLESTLIAFIAAYTSYQLYGWGVYISRLVAGTPLNPDIDKECELIDDLLYPLHITLKGNKYYLYQYPRLFGFCGTTLTGFIMTFLWGLFLGNLVVILSGLGMGICYWLGYLVCKLKDDGKYGWNWGEWIFGAYLGAVLAWVLLW